VILALIAGLLLVSCSGGSPSQGAASVAGPTAATEVPAGSEGTVETPLHVRPVISNLTITFPRPCTLENGRSGTIELIRFNYRDPDGNVRGGRVEDSIEFAGRSEVFVLSIPSRGVTITGTTSGVISLAFCLRFGDAEYFVETLRIVDRAGLRSNTLSKVVTKPPGLPQVRRIETPTAEAPIREAPPE
jgi:hypothetical protein